MTFRFLALGSLVVCGAATHAEAQTQSLSSPQATQAPMSSLSGALPGSLSGSFQISNGLPSLTALQRPGSQITHAPALTARDLLPHADRVLVLTSPATDATRSPAPTPAMATVTQPASKPPAPTAPMVSVAPVVAPLATRFELGHWVKPINANLQLSPPRPEAATAEPGFKSPAPTAATESVVLAQLDSDLSLASHNLDRAESQLSDGERQLSGFTNVLQQAMLEAGADARGLNPFVRVAERYLGTPYVWGGVSGRGFDCSGFIIRVMHDLGYRSLPHSAAEQFRYGMPVANALLKPGDLVFFANTYKPGISHVGIFLGHRRFIHAANSNVGTIVSSIDEPKWVQKYAGARRLLPVSN